MSKQRPPAPLVKESGVRVPMLRAVAHHIGHGRYRGPDPALVDEPPASLQPGAQERIGGAADSQTVFVGQTQQGGTLFPVEAKRLFKVDVLAVPERRRC